MSYRNRKPRGPEYGQGSVYTHEDGTVIHRQRKYVGYGFSEGHAVGTLEGIAAFYEREKCAYPINGYGGHYGTPQDLGNDLFIGYWSHSESCE